MHGLTLTLLIFSSACLWILAHLYVAQRLIVFETVQLSVSVRQSVCLCFVMECYSITARCGLQPVKRGVAIVTAWDVLPKCPCRPDSKTCIWNVKLWQRVIIPQHMHTLKIYSSMIKQYWYFSEACQKYDWIWLFDKLNNGFYNEAVAMANVHEQCSCSILKLHLILNRHLRGIFYSWKLLWKILKAEIWLITEISDDRWQFSLVESFDNLLNFHNGFKTRLHNAKIDNTWHYIYNIIYFTYYHNLLYVILLFTCTGIMVYC